MWVRLPLAHTPISRNNPSRPASEHIATMRSGTHGDSPPVQSDNPPRACFTHHHPHPRRLWRNNADVRCVKYDVRCKMKRNRTHHWWARFTFVQLECIIITGEIWRRSCRRRHAGYRRWLPNYVSYVQIKGIKGRFSDPLISLALLIVSVFLLIIVRVIDTFHEYFSVIYLVS